MILILTYFIDKEKPLKFHPKEFCKTGKWTFINVQNGLLQNSFE
jgi:hypothetical protein